MATFISLSIISLALLALPTWADEGHAETDYSYSGPNGPDKWGGMNPSYSSCSNGKAQSPVDVTNNNVVLNKEWKSFDRIYNNVNATLVNSEHYTEVEFEGEVGYVEIDGKQYYLEKLHWHSPAEHQIDGKRYDAELHMVHKTHDRSAAAVVAVLYQLGHSDPFISNIENKLLQLANDKCANKIPLGTLDVSALKKKTSRYYRYLGSLTTPPCHENITWTILGKVESISMKQLYLLKAPLAPQFKRNARPVQSLNGRKIDMYDDLES